MDDATARIALAKSLLGHGGPHAVDEALLALQGASIDEIARLRQSREEEARAT